MSVISWLDTNINRYIYTNVRLSTTLTLILILKKRQIGAHILLLILSDTIQYSAMQCRDSIHSKCWTPLSDVDIIKRIEAPLAFFLSLSLLNTISQFRSALIYPNPIRIYATHSNNMSDKLTKTTNWCGKMVWWNKHREWHPFGQIPMHMDRMFWVKRGRIIYIYMNK